MAVLDQFRAKYPLDTPALVVSMLGDTSAGKSNTIRELMGEREDRPYVHVGGGQAGATTYNVNLFCSHAISDEALVAFVDYEGENGTDNPAMALGRLRGAAAGESDRFRAVADVFPKLAYATSDVIIMVSREPLYHRSYLERCLSLAKRANAGVANVERPTLILLANKLPGEEVLVDVSQSSKQFFDAWGSASERLDEFFSCVIAIHLPHKSSMWRDGSGQIVDGADIFSAQINKLRAILAVAAARNVASDAAMAEKRVMTTSFGLWLELLPRVVQEMAAGRGVDAGALYDKAWAVAMAGQSHGAASTLAAVRSVIAAFRPSRNLSAGARRYNEDVILRWEHHRDLCLALAARIIAARARRVPRTWMVPARLQATAREVLSETAGLLDELLPCVAVYPDTERGNCPVHRTDEPVLCLQDSRMHSGARPMHRTSRLVKSAPHAASLWHRLMAHAPHNDVWPGEFVAPAVPEAQLEQAVQNVLRAVELPDAQWLEMLVQLQQAHTDELGRTRIGFARISDLHPPEFAPDASPPTPGTAQPTDLQVHIADCAVAAGWRGPVSQHVRATARCSLAAAVPQEAPLCFGCGLSRSAHSADPASFTAAELGGPAHSVASWAHRVLVAVGLISATGVEQAAACEVAEVVDVPASPSPSLPSPVADGANEQNKPKRVSFQEDLFSASGMSISSVESGVPRLSTKRPASSASTACPALPTHYVWLGLCTRCWGALSN